MPNMNDPEVQRMMKEVFEKEYAANAEAFLKVCIPADKIRKLQNNSDSVNEKGGVDVKDQD